jgi:hypothetical protein
MKGVFAQDDQLILGQDPMCREPIDKDIKLAFRVKSNGLVSLSGLQTTIQNSMISYINALSLGSKVSQSDLVNIVEDIPGVDLVYLPFEKFNYRNDIGAVEDTLTTESIEYLQIGSFDFPMNVKALLSVGGSLSASTPYYYVVLAEDIDGNLTKSSEVSQTTTIPNKTITVSWDLVPDAVKYWLYRGLATTVYTGHFLEILQPTTEIVSFTDAGTATFVTATIPDVTEEQKVSLIEVTVQ